MLGKIGDILGSVLGLVDDLVTTDEERMQLKVPLLALQTQVITTVIEAEKSALESRAAIITAEAQSTHWLTATWRPITMLTFLALIVIGQFGGTPVPPEMWPLLKLGLGGYVIGRSAEKMVVALKSEEIV